MKDDLEEFRLFLQQSVEDPDFEPIYPPSVFPCELCQGDGGWWTRPFRKGHEEDYRSTLYVDKEKYLICNGCVEKMVRPVPTYYDYFTYKFGSLKRCLIDRCGQLRKRQTLRTVRSVKLIEWSDKPSPKDEVFRIPIS